MKRGNLTSTNPDDWRVGKREGQKNWQIKMAPGWAVATECKDLFDCAKWLSERGVDIRLVPVLTGWPRKNLGQYIAEAA